MGEKTSKTKRSCIDSILGMFIGFILLGLAFVPTWFSAKGVRELSKEVKAMLPIRAEEATGKSGTFMLYGEPSDIEALELAIECEYVNKTIDVFGYHLTVKEYTSHVKEEETRQGTKRNTVSDWEVIQEEKKTANFKLGEIDIFTHKADVRLHYPERCEKPGREQVGERWLIYEYLPVEDVKNVKIYVVGNIQNNSIRDGDPFIITDQPPEKLVATLAEEEKTTRFAFGLIGVIMFFLAFNLILGPLILVLQGIPVIGRALRASIAFVSLVLAIALVLILRIAFLYWWVVLFVVGILIALLLIAMLSTKGKKSAPSTVTSTQEPHATCFCPNCGTPLPEGAKFCQDCGTSVKT